MVGLGRVGSAGHDGLERGPARPQAPHLEVEAPTEGLLGQAATQLGAEAVEGLVGDAGRLGQAGELAGVLDPAQPFDQTDGRHQLDVREPVVGERALLLPAHVGRFEGQAADAAVGHDLPGPVPLVGGLATTTRASTPAASSCSPAWVP